MLKRLGQRGGVPNLHTHRFRHTYSIKMIEAGVPLPVLELMGGWKRIPRTYLSTLGDKAAREFHQKVSPADRLAKTVRRK
jgi:integrase